MAFARAVQLDADIADKVRAAQSGDQSGSLGRGSTSTSGHCAVGAWAHGPHTHDEAHVVEAGGEDADMARAIRESMATAKDDYFGGGGGGGGGGKSRCARARRPRGRDSVRGAERGG